MLRAPLALILIVGCSLLGTEVQRRLQARGIRLPVIEGVFWILLGVGLGSRGLGLLPGDILLRLHPVVLLALAWVGLVFGMQVEFRVIRRLEGWHRALGLLFPLITGAMVGLACLQFGTGVLTAAGLGAVAMLSAPEGLDALSRSRRPLNRGAVRFLRLLSAFSGIPAIVAFGLASVLFSPVSSLAGGHLPWVTVLVEIGGVGLLAGYALLAMARGQAEPLANITILIGITALIAGATSIMGISPLPAAALAGAIVINRCIFPHRLLKAAHLFERPLLIALMVLVGAAVKALSFSWWVFVILALLRSLSLIGSGWVLSEMLQRRGLSPRTPGLGIGLFPQGALSLGLLLALMSVAHPPPGFLEAAAAAMILNQVVGEFWLRRRLFVPRSTS